MNPSPESLRSLESSHSASPVLPILEGQVVIEDTRLRAWKLAQGGVLGYANPIVAKLNNDGDILRIRTIDGVYAYSGTLDIRYATPSSSITWSSNTITAGALGGGGVDLWIDGDDVDAFWVETDAVTIKTAHSSNGGHTWGASSTVYTLGGQGLNVLAQLTAPQLDTLIFTDSTVGVDDSNNPLTALYVVVRIAGVWQTPVQWDMGGQHLGVEQRVTLPNGDEYPSNLSSLALSDGRVEVAYYGHELQESFEDGIWIQRIGNLKFVAPASQHLHWTHPQSAFGTVAIDDDNNSTQVFASFPRLQQVGNEYWIVALESSKFVGHQRYHLGFFRSSDGLTFTDRYYNQGASNDDSSGAYLYDEVTPFLVEDIIYANLIVTDTYTFIVGFDKVFYCPSTSLVGVDNPDRQTDLTYYVSQYTVSLPSAPASASATINLNVIDREWDDTDILSAHRGIIARLKAGYRHYIYGDELIDIGTFHVDKVNQSTEVGSSLGNLTVLDNTMLLDRYKADTYWEYNSPKQMNYDLFCDLTPFLITAGSFTTGLGGRLKSGIVNTNDSFRDDIAAFNTDPASSSFAYFRFRCDRTWTHNHAGFVFQGRNQGDEQDNKSYWAVLYNKTAGRFTLNRAVPRTNPNRTKLYRYEAHVVQSDSIVLSASTWYWMRVGVWHGHIKVWYANDVSQTTDTVWTQVFDYKSQASPASHVIPSRIGWNALVGTQKVQPSGAIGLTGSSGGQQDMSDGAGNPRLYALHVVLGDQPSYLRRVNVAITQENTNSSPMPDVGIQLAAGDSNAPFDLTDDENIYFSGDASALHFSVHDRPKFLGANARPNPGRPQFDPYTDLWICVTFNEALVSGQSYKFSSDTHAGRTMYSDDGGATWTHWGDGTVNMTASVEVEYINGRVKFHKLYYASGETPKTYEGLAHEIAAKAGVLDITPDSWVAQSDLTLTDGVYWQPEVFGTIGDFVADADVTVSGSPYSRIAKFIFGSTDVITDGSNGYYVELDPDENEISVYTHGNVLLSQASSLQHIPSDAYHLQVVNQNGSLTIYINECMAFFHHSEGFKDAGFVGLDATGATWTNFRIPDLHQLVDYFALQTNESALSALQRLVSKPAAGSIAKGKFFILPDGSLRIGSFTRRTVVDTYEDNVFTADKSEDSQNVITQYEANGNYYALAVDSVRLDTDGRWFEVKDLTDASSDANAYLAAEGEFRDNEEKGLTQSYTTAANFGLYREDAIRAISADDKTNQIMIVNDMQLTIGIEPTESAMTLNLRKYTDA